MPIASDPKQPFSHVLEVDKALPHEQQTRWQLKPLTTREFMWLKDHTTNVDGKFLDGTWHLLVINLGLIGWDQFFRMDGTPIVFHANDQMLAGEKRPVIDENLIELLKPQWISELCSEVLSRTLMSEADAKK